MSWQEKETISLYLLPLWQILLFTYTGLQVRAGTREYSLHFGSTQIQANTTALLNIAFNLDTDYSVLEKLQLKGEQQKLC